MTISTDRQHWGRALALLEVSLAFALVHVSYRAFKHFTPLGREEVAAGLNYSAGSTMILFSVGLVLLFGRNLADYGLTLKNWRVNVTIGLLCGFLLAAGSALVIKLTSIPPAAFHQPTLPTAVAGSLGHLVMTLVVLLVLRRNRPQLQRWPVALSLLLLFGLLTLPIALAVVVQQSPWETIAAMGWLFIGAGFGEEIFFRGYIQSRIDQAFGKPFCVLGLDFGAGLVVSSLFFGLIHVLNTVDYFAGRYDFAWWSGVSNCFAGLFFGCLRERTRSILAGAIAHGLLDALAQIVRILEIER